MLGQDSFFVLPAVAPPGFAGVLGYAGPGPGLELIPYFIGLLTWAGVAFGAVILWPISKLLRRLRKGRHQVDTLPAPADVVLREERVDPS